MKHSHRFRVFLGAAAGFAVLAACHSAPAPVGSGDAAVDPATRLRLLSKDGSVCPPPTGCEAGIPFSQGFETDTEGWFPNSGDLARVLSGSSGTTYAPGIAAAEGNAFARLTLGEVTSCNSASGLQPVRSGPFTRWGCYGCTFPENGFDTEIAIYLDVAYATNNPDTRFDWVTAINGAAATDGTCTHRRDFAFNVGTNTTGFVISASTNSTRCGVNPYEASHLPVTIAQSGWYTFSHSFDVVAGQLVVTLTLTRRSDNQVVGTWVLAEPSDTASVIGSNRYGWFPNNEFPDLPIDISQRIGGQCCDAPTP